MIVRDGALEMQPAQAVLQHLRRPGSWPSPVALHTHPAVCLHFVAFRGVGSDDTSLGRRDRQKWSNIPKHTISMACGVGRALCS